MMNKIVTTAIPGTKGTLQIDQTRTGLISLAMLGPRNGVRWHMLFDLEKLREGLRKAGLAELDPMSETWLDHYEDW